MLIFTCADPEIFVTGGPTLTTLFVFLFVCFFVVFFLLLLFCLFCFFFGGGWGLVNKGREDNRAIIGPPAKRGPMMAQH